jgi:hypothetical protein
MALTPAVSNSFVIGAGADLWTPIAPTTFTTSYVAHTGSVVGPLTGGLQQAINNAARGDLIVVANGSIHTNIDLPAKALDGTKTVNIVSEAFYNETVLGGGNIKGVGERVTPADIGLLQPSTPISAAPTRATTASSLSTSTSRPIQHTRIR